MVDTVTAKDTSEGSMSWRERTLVAAGLGIASLIGGWFHRDQIDRGINDGLRTLVGDARTDPALAELRRPALVPDLTAVGEPEVVGDVFYDEALDSYVVKRLNGNTTTHRRDTVFTTSGNPDDPASPNQVGQAKDEFGNTYTVIFSAGDFAEKSDSDRQPPASTAQGNTAQATEGSVRGERSSGTTN